MTPSAAATISSVTLSIADFESPADLPGLDEVPPSNPLNSVMVCGANGHRELHLLTLDLAGVETGLSQKNVIGGRQAVTAARARMGSLL